MKALLIGSLVLKRLSRDRIALFFILLLPTLIILVVGVAIFGASGPAGQRSEMGFLDEGSGTLGAQLVKTLSETSHLHLVRYGDIEAVRTDIRRETIDAAIVLPAGYSDALFAGKSASVSFIAPTVDPAPLLRSVVSRKVAEQGAVVRAAVFASKTASITIDAALAGAQAAAAQPQSSVEVSSEVLGVTKKKEVHVPTGFRYPAASNLVLFIFISSLASSARLVEARALGLPKRMLSTPTSARTILFGEALGGFIIAAVQGMFIFVAGAILFKVNWGDPLGTAALILLFALVGTSAQALAGASFRTPEQAQSVGPPIGIALGMLGGCMWPLEIVPPLMRAVGHITPHSWAMDAFIDLTVKGEGLPGILPQLGVLAAFVAVLLPLGAIRLRRALTG